MSGEKTGINLLSPDSNHLIGLTLAVSSSLFIGSSFIIKKLSLNRLSKQNTLRASVGGFGYLKDWIWWTGFLTMAIGEAANFIAYAYAPASLVTPLGALSVLVSTILAAKYLKEHLNKLAKVGCLLCIFGSMIIIFHAPKEIDPDSLIFLLYQLQQFPFILYVISALTTSGFFMFYVAPKYGNKHAVVYIFICSTIGSLSVMSCKALGISLREILTSNNGRFEVVIGSFLILITCICIQMAYLNKALDIFGASIVTPLYYVIFTSCVLLASAILFEEWHYMTALNTLWTLCGFAVVVSAIFLLQGSKQFQNDFGKDNISANIVQQLAYTS